MKKSILSFLAAALLMLVAAPANAQIKFGVTGGLNVSKMSFSNLGSSLSSENRAGWFIGPKVEAKLPLIGLGVDAAVEYSQRALYGEANGANSSEKYKSIEIPINVRYSIGLASLASLYAATGPQFGFNVGDSEWASAFKFKKSFVTWNVGAGVKLLNHLELGVGYNIALSKLAETIGAAGSFKSNTWQISATYLF